MIYGSAELLVIVLLIWLFSKRSLNKYQAVHLSSLHYIKPGTPIIEIFKPPGSVLLLYRNYFHIIPQDKSHEKIITSHWRWRLYVPAYSLFPPCPAGFEVYLNNKLILQRFGKQLENAQTIEPKAPQAMNSPSNTIIAAGWARTE
jgi:hypothetical protein